MKPDEAKWIVGEDLPPEIQKIMKEPIYDMILVERISAPTATVSGIFLPPGPDGKDRRKLGKVLAIPKLGLESEQGRVQQMSELVNCGEPFLKPGDVVFLQDDWGIGPKNIEVGERKFSFHKALHVLGIVR
jgi:co-chaperonin GroES (HSP10)